MRITHQNRSRALAFLLGFSAGAGVLPAQELKQPDLPSFEEYLSERLPGLSVKGSQRPDAALFQHIDEGIPGKAALTAVDNTTGLIPPAYPFKGPLEQLPANDPKTTEYRKQLAIFQDRRQQVLQVKDEYLAAVGERARLKLMNVVPPSTVDYTAAKISSWNGDIFWAPASQTADINLRFGDEARAVFGPIPPFDVTTIGTFTRPDGSTIETESLTTEVNGNRIELQPNNSKPGKPLEFAAIDPSGKILSWSNTIDKCDKPSLAGGVTPCGIASRLSRIVRGNVEWIALARKTKGVEPLDTDPYWSASDPTYTLLGYIGFNMISGEVVFFDGTYLPDMGAKSIRRFNWKEPIVPPGGNGYADTIGRATSALTYDSTFSIECVACHNNKKPLIIDPYIKQARVGYRDPVLAAAFGMQTLLPKFIRSSSKPYRVVGSGYTAAHSQALGTIRTIIDPTGNCSECHGLTGPAQYSNGAKFASDAVARLGSLGDGNVEDGFRTAWALRTGVGMIHPWMVPDNGNDLTGNPPPPVLADADWAKLGAELTTPSATSVPVFTQAPAPESPIGDLTRIADPAAPTDFQITTGNNRQGTSEPLPNEIHISWKYLNTLGGVPERDDVRFNIAIISVPLPTAPGNPTPNQFPSIDETKGVGATSIGGGVLSDGKAIIIENVSFKGHLKWTDPNPATLPRQYEVDLPAAANSRYLIRILAKRFSFDQTGEQYSNVDHVYSVDFP